jgi:DNA invertase Pin-like site-specific DNA recombinase
MLNVLMSVAQWEREAISERTQEAMNELKRRGVRMGGAPYGWQYAKEPDEHGRRNIVMHPGEQRVIQRICTLHREGLSVLDIAKRLTAEGVRPRGTEWERPTLYRILERAGLLTLPRRAKKESADGQKKQGPTRDKTIAIKQAHVLRAQGLSLRQIGEKLRKARILPTRGEVWHAASVLDLLRHAASTG